jgi:hypothetical protein
MTENPDHNEDPYQKAHLYLSRGKLSVIKMKMEQRGHVLMVDEALVVQYLMEANEDTGIYFEMVMNPMLADYFDQKDAEVLSDVAAEKCGDILISESGAEECAKAMDKDISSVIRMYYLVHELISNEDYYGPSIFLRDVSTGVLQGAKKYGLNLPLAWKNGFTRDSIADIIAEIRSGEHEEEEIEAMASFPPIQNEETSEINFYHQLMKERLQIFIAKNPDPVEFVKRFLDLEKLEELRRIQLESQ